MPAFFYQLIITSAPFWENEILDDVTASVLKALVTRRMPILAVNQDLRLRKTSTSTRSRWGRAWWLFFLNFIFLVGIIFSEN